MLTLTLKQSSPKVPASEGPVDGQLNRTMYTQVGTYRYLHIIIDERIPSVISGAGNPASVNVQCATENSTCGHCGLAGKTRLLAPC